MCESDVNFIKETKSFKGFSKLFTVQSPVDKLNNSALQIIESSSAFLSKRFSQEI